MDIILDRQHKYHKVRAAFRHYATQTALCEGSFEALVYTSTSHPATRHRYRGQKVPHALMCLFSGNLRVAVDLIRR